MTEPTHPSYRTLCSCNRLLVKNHCTQCGSYEVRAYVSKVRRGKELVRRYRCRRCAAVYTDVDRRNCQAPVGNHMSRKQILAIEDSPQIPIEQLFEQARATDRLDTIRNKNR